MTVAPRQEARGSATRPAGLPQGKSRELLGVLFFCFALLLLVALVSYHPDDTSLFHESSENVGARNWIGPAGAEVSALVFSLFGLPALLIPVALLAAGWRRLRKDSPPRVVGRGLGLGLLLLGLPPLMQLVLGQVTWRGVAMDSGGLYGFFVANLMEGRLNFVGALLVLATLMAVGLTLALQSSLEDLLKAGARVGRSRSEALTLAVARHRERREKERSRRRVVAKHLQRAREKEGARELVSARVSSARSHEPQPVRVRVRRGEGSFGIRRVDEVAAVDEGLVELAGPAARRGAPGEREPAPEAADPTSSRGVARPPLRSGEAGPHAVQSARSAAVGQTSLKLPKASRSQLPPINLLNLEKTRPNFDEDELIQLGELICQRCAEFGVEGTIEGITPGPVITVFELQPAPGVKVSRIVNLQDDLALSLKAESIRIDRIPGRSTLGIEIPNPERATIHLGPLLADPKFRRAKSPLTMALGHTLHGEHYYVDLAKMPHLLVAGATGAGKSVALNAMITSILYKATRDQVQFIFIDPKRIELGTYSNIPHLKAEVVVEPKQAANALRWAVGEMERRYRLLAEVHVRSIDFYNQAIADPEVRKRLSLREDGAGEEIEDGLAPLPYYVIVIDELADLMMVSSSEVETCIARLAQMARAVGIHLIVATQRPSVDVLTGMIKANFPCRIAFATASRHDSRTILDQIGSEKLLGRGDALFMPPGSSRIMRLHGAYLSEQETAGLVRWLKKQGKPELDPEVLKGQEDESGGGAGGGGPADDALYEDAARLVVAEGKASASFLQRRMRVGFSRAARLIDMMEQDGLLGPSQGSKPREILVKADYFEEIDGHQ